MQLHRLWLKQKIFISLMMHQTNWIWPVQYVFRKLIWPFGWPTFWCTSVSLNWCWCQTSRTLDSCAGLKWGLMGASNQKMHSWRCGQSQHSIVLYGALDRLMCCGLRCLTFQYFQYISSSVVWVSPDMKLPKEHRPKPLRKRTYRQPFHSSSVRTFLILQ